MASKLRWVVSDNLQLSVERTKALLEADFFPLNYRIYCHLHLYFSLPLPSLLSFTFFTACVLCFKLSDDKPQAETGRRVKEPEFNDCFQGCDSHITWQTVTAFRWNLLPPSSRQKSKPCGREVHNYLPELTASHLKRIQLSYKPPENFKPGSKTFWWLQSSRGDSIVNMITRLRAGRSGVRIISGARDVSSPNRPDQHWDPPSFLYNGYQSSFLGVKRQVYEVDH